MSSLNKVLPFASVPVDFFEFDSCERTLSRVIGKLENKAP